MHDMTEDEIAERHAFGAALIEEAGALALDYFRRVEELTVSAKGPQDVVSEADVEVERMIRARIAAAFPQDAFLGEESGRTEFTAGQGIWVVDPIDGTQPFVSGMSSWCVSIAFVADGRARLGYIVAPARDELFIGRVGHGATLNGRPIAVKRVGSVTEGIVAAGYSLRLPPDAFLPAFTRLLEAGGVFYRDGSGALALAYVACGRLIGYAEAQINAWDCLGALALIEAAGGVSNDFLAGDGLWSGAPLVTASPELYPSLAALWFG
jgi:myo-inositol-1(or 4)-monophosphatase